MRAEKHVKKSEKKIMVGYSGYSISNRAISAYEEGKLPLSKVKSLLKKAIKKINLNTKENLDLINNLDKSDSAEWHHTSSKYNITYFFCPFSILGHIVDSESIQIILTRCAEFFEPDFTYADSAQEIWEKFNKTLSKENLEEIKSREISWYREILLEPERSTESKNKILEEIREIENFKF